MMTVPQLIMIVMVYMKHDYDLGELHGNRIIDADILSAKVSASTVCRFCHGELDFIEVSRKGLGSEFAFHCNNKHCNQQTSFHSCEQIPVGSLSVSSINRRSVFAMRCVGGDHAELATFCAMMDLPPPVQEKSVNIIKKKTILKACTTVQKASCKKAAQTEHKLAQGEDGDPCRDVDVSSDGTWMTPGVNSVVWKYCPKKKNHGVTVVKVAAAMAVSVFSDGAQSLLDIMIAMELSVGKFASDFCKQKDSHRIKNAKRQAKDASHEARIAKRRKRKAVDEEQAELEGQPYVAGGY